MTGKYSLKELPTVSDLNPQEFRNKWGRFCSICRSLDRDGLEYSVSIGKSPNFDQAFTLDVVIEAAGKVRPKPAPKYYTKVSNTPMTAKLCRKRREEATRAEVEADIQYWTEMERLALERESGNRPKIIYPKPGMLTVASVLIRLQTLRDTARLPIEVEYIEHYSQVEYLLRISPAAGRDAELVHAMARAEEMEIAA